MKINIVTVDSGWILQKISERTADACNEKVEGHSMTVSSYVADPNADVNYYVDLQNCYSGQRSKCDVAYVTHAHENSKPWLLNLLHSRHAEYLNGIVSMNERYTEMLGELGYPKEKLITITPGETRGMFPLRKIKIGVVSRGGYEGYGQFFMEKMLQNYDFTNFKLRFLGNGWEALVPIAKEYNIDLEIIGDADYEVYPKFYQDIDHLLIPGLWTAGPISFQEALSSGTSVISANVGFATYEFHADYTFEANNMLQLSEILNLIKEPLLARRAQVEDMTWEKYARDLISFFEKVK